MIYQIYDYKPSMNWENISTNEKRPVSSEIFIRNMLNSSIENNLFDFILVVNHKLNFFLRKVYFNSIYSNSQVIIENLDYFIKLIMRGDVIMGMSCCLNKLVELIEKNYWSISDNNSNEFQKDINMMFSQDTLSIISIVKSNNILFINHDADPIYLMHK